MRSIRRIAACLETFESVERSVPRLLELVHARLPLASSILIEGRDGTVVKHVWHAQGAGPGALLRAESNAMTAYSFLAGPLPWRRTPIEVIRTPLPFMRRSTEALSAVGASDERDFIMLPLAIRSGAIFGALQVEGLRDLEEADLALVGEVVADLAIAIDRSHGRRTAVHAFSR